MLWILRWFGLILLPIVSFSADGVVAICKFGIKVVQWFLPNLKIYQSSQQKSTRPTPPCREHSARDTMYKDRKLHHSEFAHGLPIDLSIHFTLFWTPLLVLLGWLFRPKRQCTSPGPRTDGIAVHGGIIPRAAKPRHASRLGHLRTSFCDGVHPLRKSQVLRRIRWSSEVWC